MMMIVVVVLVQVVVVIGTQGISVSYQWRGRLQYLIASIIASTMFLDTQWQLKQTCEGFANCVTLKDITTLQIYIAAVCYLTEDKTADVPFLTCFFLSQQ